MLSLTSAFTELSASTGALSTRFEAIELNRKGHIGFRRIDDFTGKYPFDPAHPRLGYTPPRALIWRPSEN